MLKHFEGVLFSNFGHVYHPGGGGVRHFLKDLPESPKEIPFLLNSVGLRKNNYYAQKVLFISLLQITY